MTEDPKYIVLYNPHSQEWLLFEYEYGKEKYAPNYGTPITNGATPKDAISFAINLFEINEDEIEICY